ncbi:MAG: metallophosphoesterase [Clostridia bacterium]|nr:metallophosphoesterase [Clostridia bacterium]
MKKTAALLLSVLMTVLCLVPAGAMSADEWKSYISENTEIEKAVHVSNGNRDSERFFTWYGDSEDCKVYISRSEDMSDSLEFEGKGTLNPQGDYTERVFADGLEAGIYYYVCESEGFKSSPATVSVTQGADFSAMYVTDVHMTRNYDTDNAEMIENENQFNNMLEKASEKGAQLLLSSGDQATNGERIEYTAFTSSPVIKNMSIALCIGNHDKKDIDYRYFASYPDIKYPGFKAYVGKDYWFTKGDVLFMVLDVNCADTVAHRAFMQNAVLSNPDIKWRVCVFHNDLFGGRIESRETENRSLRLIFVPLMDEFMIDLVLMGHSHYYTQSNVIYGGRTVEKTENNSVIDNAKGTVYVVSGSAREGRYVDGGEIPPLGKHIGYDYLTEKGIYNILDFSEDSIILSSYTLESDEPFNTLTLNKTDAKGGHKISLSGIWNLPARLISVIAAISTNIDRFSTLKEKGIHIPFGEALFGIKKVYN